MCNLVAKTAAALVSPPRKSAALILSVYHIKKVYDVIFVPISFY